jgi:HEAT repeat protein
LKQPAAHLPPADDVTAEALCRWIRGTWFETKGHQQSLNRDAREIAGVTRVQVVGLLCDLGRSAQSPNRPLALELLAAFEDASAYDVFISALADKDHYLRIPAAKGLKALRDRRAVPHLIRALEEIGDSHAVRIPICDALGALGDPAAVPALIRQLQLRHYGGPEDALAKIRDPRALPALLEAVWRDESGIHAVLAFKDPAIIEQARQRMYDHPSAPYVLAIRGDPSARPLMLKLLRQRDPAGTIWAEKTADPEAARLVSEARGTLWTTQLIVAAKRALADRNDPRGVAKAARLLQLQTTVADAVRLLEDHLKLDVPAGMEWMARLRRLYEALLADADRFGLSMSMRRWLEGAAGRPLSPDPHSLPDVPLQWPPETGAAARARFISEHRDAFAHYLRDPDVPDIDRAVMHGRLTNIGMHVLDESAMKALLREPGPHLHALVLYEHAKGRVALGAADIRAVLASPALSQWLHHVAQTKTCDHPQVLQELIEQDWAVSSRELHAALRATRHEAAIPRLRELLVENTIDVRREAAVTLAHVGDASGLKIIEQELARYSDQKYQHYSWGHEASAALRRLTGRSR